MTKADKNQWLNIPNILTIFRIILVPVIAWLYNFQERYLAAGIVVVISALTDLADGYIARKYNLVTDLGKILDPIADKLSQGIIFISLISRFPYLIYPFLLFLLKELFSGILYLLALRKTKEVTGAQWHGKVNTVLLYGVFIIHIFYYNIPKKISLILVAVIVATMVFSLIMYTSQFIRILRED